MSKIACRVCWLTGICISLAAVVLVEFAGLPRLNCLQLRNDLLNYFLASTPLRMTSVRLHHQVPGCHDSITKCIPCPSFLYLQQLVPTMLASHCQQQHHLVLDMIHLLHQGKIRVKEDIQNVDHWIGIMDEHITDPSIFSPPAVAKAYNTCLT